MSTFFEDKYIFGICRKIFDRLVFVIIFLCCILTKNIYDHNLNYSIMHKTKMDFLDQVVWEVEKGMKLASGQKVFSFPFILAETKNNFEKFTQLCGFGPYKWFVVDSKLLETHKSQIESLVSTICFGSPSLARMQQRWEENGYDIRKFQLFHVLVLSQNYVVYHPNRYGGWYATL